MESIAIVLMGIMINVVFVNLCIWRIVDLLREHNAIEREKMQKDKEG